MIPIATKASLRFLTPIRSLLQPVPTQELPNTRVCRLLLRTLQRHQLVEVLVNARGLTVASSATDGRAMTVDIVLVADVFEVPDLALRNKHGHRQGVDGSITETLVVETAAPVKPFEVLLVCLTTEEAQVADFEVGEELAVVVVATIVRVE